MIPILFVIAVTVATIWLGVRAKGTSKSAADMFVAGRSVSVFWNASAISGEYLSAASFMGVAGLVMKNGYDALWYPVGYAAGYLFLLLFIAGPLRRFGAYTIPDFAEGRFNSPQFRKISVSFVLFIGFFYTMPQMKGAGVTMEAILGVPYWVGIIVVGAVITYNVAIGGMKGITLVQAFQYWVKVFAISLPVFVLMAVFGGYGGKLSQFSSGPKDLPVVHEEPIQVKGAKRAPDNQITLAPNEQTLLKFESEAVLSNVSVVPKTKPGEEIPLAPTINVIGDARLRVEPGLSGITIPKNTLIDVKPGTGSGRKGSLKLEFQEPASVRILAPAQSGRFASSPNTVTNEKWLNPFGPLTSKHGYPLLYTYSLIIALVCGTAGLPHILVRFYTNPDGRAAKRTTLWVMVMLGGFYAFTPVWGTLGRVLMPELYASSDTDKVVIQLPLMMANETLGQVLKGITSAGAFAAFMSTFSGLLVSMSGAFAHDIYGKILRPHASLDDCLRMFRVAAWSIGLVSMGLGLLVASFDIAMMVGWAFAIGAASYFPLLLLGSWWRGLTAPGAASGMLAGGVLSLGAIVTTMMIDKKVISLELSPLVRSLMEQPAIWGVPVALFTMFLVSKATQSAIPTDIDLKMLRLHAPEELGLSKNYIDN